MTKYEKQILNVLIDKYEGSKSFIGTNQVNQSFTCKLDQLFPKYKDDSEYDGTGNFQCFKSFET